MQGDDADPIRVWLVERTYSDDEQIILTYATTDGTRHHRKERAVPSPSDVRETAAAVDVHPANLGTVDDSGVRERYAAAARRMAEEHAPDDAV